MKGGMKESVKEVRGGSVRTIEITPTLQDGYSVGASPSSSLLLVLLPYTRTVVRAPAPLRLCNNLLTPQNDLLTYRCEGTCTPTAVLDRIVAK